MTLTVSAVICTYTEDRWDQLGAAVDSLRTQTRRPDEIIVVVDHNPTMAARARAELDGVVVLDNADVQGLSGGKNTALRAAIGDVVGFLDDDAVAAPDWLEVLLGHLEGDGAAVGAGSAVEPAWASDAPRWFPSEFGWVVGCSYRGMPEVPSPVRNPFGGAMVVRRDVALEVGGFRTDLGRVHGLPAGCEETEFCIQASRVSGGRFIYDPRTRIDHHVPDGRTRFRYFVERCYHEGISKARVADSVGSDAALATERTYVRDVLRTGVQRGVVDGVRGDVGGLGRAAAIVAGLAATTTGYGAARLRRVAGRGAPALAPSR